MLLELLDEDTSVKPTGNVIEALNDRLRVISAMKIMRRTRTTESYWNWKRRKMSEKALCSMTSYCC